MEVETAGTRREINQVRSQRVYLGRDESLLGGEFLAALDHFLVRVSLEPVHQVPRLTYS